jgi:hypothetical protein
MYVNKNRFFKMMAGTVLAIALAADAQTQVPTTQTAVPTQAATPTAVDQTPAAPAPLTWHIGPMQISGFVDLYYSYNANHPSYEGNGQINQLYNFNDKTNQVSLSAAKLTLNHDPNPVGAHLDLIFGRTNELMNGLASADNLKYIEQAFLSLKPPKAKGMELDLGKFVTSAGAEVIESKDNWNYSRSLLFTYAIPYFHLGLRTSMPVSKTETVGVQVVNGWNNVSKSDGGPTVGLTSAYVKPKYTWNVNYYTGWENPGDQQSYRNLIDTTLLLTPTAKFNAYINYDYGQNRDSVTGSGESATGDNLLKHWQGVAFAAHQQLTAKAALAGRFEHYDDPQGFTTGAKQQVNEFTATGEYKWPKGLLGRLEFRRDWSDAEFFTRGNSPLAVKDQCTVTASIVVFFGPNR